MKRFTQMKIRKLLYIGLVLLLAGCSSDEEEQVQRQYGVLQLTSSVSPIDGETVTRTNLAGTDFVTGDRIKLKIICPYSDHTEFGETTYGNTFDALWLLKWNGSGWAKLEPKDSVDVAGEYKFGQSYDLFGRYEAQQTPYIYTASTWNENVIFLAPKDVGGAQTRYSQYTYVFQADQTTKANFLKSDLLWAQTYMQTGSYNVHLAFNHVMACLKIQITGVSLTSSAVVTLERMPNIDQREVVVGDYYAAKSKINSAYGYQQKCSCTKVNNGKVLGVAVINDATATADVYPMTGNPNPNSRTPITNDGVYTAHYEGGYYYLIIPPCELSTEAEFWIRDGEKRYSYELTRKTFEQGKLYPVNITLPTSPTLP